MVSGVVTNNPHIGLRLIFASYMSYMRPEEGVSLCCWPDAFVYLMSDYCIARDLFNDLA